MQKANSEQGRLHLAVFQHGKRGRNVALPICFQEADPSLKICYSQKQGRFVDLHSCSSDTKPPSATPSP